MTPSDARSLESAFTRLSPRLNPRPPTLAGYGVHLAVAALTLVALGGLFVFQGVMVWSSGLVFMSYDLALLLFVARQTLPLRRLREQKPPAAIEPPPLTLSVVVAAYNEAAVLEHTIASLLAQQSPPEAIFIADDGSTDDTAALLTQRYGFPLVSGGLAASPVQAGLFWLRAPHGGKARTLNRVLPHLATDLVVTVDADTRLAADALVQKRRAFAAEPCLVAATGVLAPVCDRSRQGRWLQCFQRYEYVRNFLARFAWMRADSLLLVSGAFATFRTQALRSVGGFDPECLVEDYEVIHRLYRHSVMEKLGWRVRVVGRATARTAAPSTLSGFLRQRRRWFAGFLQTQYWNRDITGNRRFGKLGRLLLPVKVMDTVQPFCGLAALASLGLLAASRHSGLLAVLIPIIATKLLLDVVFNVWGLFLYRRWTGQTEPALLPALGVTLLEPLLFQPLRHLGAVLGWYHFLTGRRYWGRQQRPAMI